MSMPKELLPVRRTPDLLLGRRSLPGTRYFVTACTEGRRPVLRDETIRETIFAVWQALEASGDWTLGAATVMPDHVHLLFTLGDRLSFDRTMAKWKGQVSRGVGHRIWQRNVFEHRLREDEDGEAYAWYVFMNPYRAGLAAPAEVWPGWRPMSSSRWVFLAAVRPGPCPQPEWLGYWDKVTGGLVLGK